MKAGHDSYVSVTPELLAKYPDAKVLKGKEHGDVITTTEYNELTGVAKLTGGGRSVLDGPNGEGPEEDAKGAARSVVPDAPAPRARSRGAAKASAKATAKRASGKRGR